MIEDDDVRKCWRILSRMGDGFTVGVRAGSSRRRDRYRERAWAVAAVAMLVMVMKCGAGGRNNGVAHEAMLEIDSRSVEP